MNIWISVICLFYILFLSFNLWIDTGLVTTRNNFSLLSFIFLSILYIFRNKRKRSIPDYLFYLLGGIIILFLSYSAIVSFPTNDIINRNFFRVLHYSILLGYIIIFIRSADRSYLIPASYLIVIHSLFFMLNDYRAIYLFPFLLIALLIEKNSKINISNSNISWGGIGVFLYFISIIATIIHTSPASIQEFRGYSLLVTMIPIILVFKNLPRYYKIKILYLIVAIFFFQAIIFNGNIFRDILRMGSINPQGTMVGLPVSTIGSLGSLGLIVSFVFILYPKTTKALLSTGSLLFLVSLVLLYFSFSRTSLLASLITFFIILMLAHKKELHKIIRSKIVWAFFILLIGISAIAFFQKSFQLTTMHVRFSLWDFHLKSVLNFSPILGLGIEPEWRMVYKFPNGLHAGTFKDIKEYIEFFQSFPNAHSFYVQIFSSFGFVGFSFFLLLLISVLKQCYSIFTKKSASLPEFVFIAVFFGISLHELTDFSSLDHQILFPSIAILSMFYHSPKIFARSFLSKINFGILLIAVGFVLISILEINLIKIHKVDLKSKYTANNLLFLKKNNSKENQIQWSLPKTDPVFKLLPEKNFYKLKYFYNKSMYDKTQDLEYLNSAAINLRKCIILNPDEPLCLYYLSNSFRELKPEGYKILSGFFLTVSQIQDPFFSIKDNP